MKLLNYNFSLLVKICNCKLYTNVSGETEIKFLAKLPKLAKLVSPHVQISETGETSDTWRN